MEYPCKKIMNTKKGLRIELYKKINFKYNPDYQLEKFDYTAFQYFDKANIREISDISHFNVSENRKMLAYQQKYIYLYEFKKFQNYFNTKPTEEDKQKFPLLVICQVKLAKKKVCSEIEKIIKDLMSLHNILNQTNINDLWKKPVFNIINQIKELSIPKKKLFGMIIDDIKKSFRELSEYQVNKDNKNHKENMDKVKEKLQIICSELKEISEKNSKYFKLNDFEFKIEKIIQFLNEKIELNTNFKYSIYGSLGESDTVIIFETNSFSLIEKYVTGIRGLEDINQKGIIVYTYSTLLIRNNYQNTTTITTTNNNDKDSAFPIIRFSVKPGKEKIVSEHLALNYGVKDIDYKFGKTSFEVTLDGRKDIHFNKDFLERKKGQEGLLDINSTFYRENIYSTYTSWTRRELLNVKRETLNTNSNNIGSDTTVVNGTIQYVGNKKGEGLKDKNVNDIFGYYFEKFRKVKEKFPNHVSEQIVNLFIYFSQVYFSIYTLDGCLDLVNIFDDFIEIIVIDGYSDTESVGNFLINMESFLNLKVMASLNSFESVEYSNIVFLESISKVLLAYTNITNSYLDSINTVFPETKFSIFFTLEPVKVTSSVYFPEALNKKYLSIGLTPSEFYQFNETIPLIMHEISHNLSLDDEYTGRFNQMLFDIIATTILEYIFISNPSAKVKKIKNIENKFQDFLKHIKLYMCFLFKTINKEITQNENEIWCLLDNLMNGKTKIEDESVNNAIKNISNEFNELNQNDFLDKMGLIIKDIPKTWINNNPYKKKEYKIGNIDIIEQCIAFNDEIYERIGQNIKVFKEIIADLIMSAIIKLTPEDYFYLITNRIRKSMNLVGDRKAEDEYLRFLITLKVLNGVKSGAVPEIKLNNIVSEGEYLRIIIRIIKKWIRESLKLETEDKTNLALISKFINNYNIDIDTLDGDIKDNIKIQQDLQIEIIEEINKILMIKAEIKEAKDKIKEAKDKINADTEIKNAKTEIEKAEAKIKNKEVEKNRKETERNKAVKNKAVKNIRSLEDKIRNIEDEIKEAKDKIKEAKYKIKQIEDKIKQIENEIEAKIHDKVVDITLKRIKTIINSKTENKKKRHIIFKFDENAKDKLTNEQQFELFLAISYKDFLEQNTFVFKSVYKELEDVYKEINMKITNPPFDLNTDFERNLGLLLSSVFSNG